MNGSIVLSMDGCQMKQLPVVRGQHSYLIRCPQQMKQAENDNLNNEDEHDPPVCKVVRESVCAVGQGLIFVLQIMSEGRGG